MKKIVLVVVMAVPAFAAGLWMQALLAEQHRPEIRTSSTPSTILPLEMHKTTPGDLPVQYMKADFN